MKTVLLACGLGSPLAEETVRIPKPMVEVGGQPIMLHLMDIYSRFGHRDFILACGYKALMIKRFFHDLHLMSNDFTMSLGDGAVSLAPCAVDLSPSLADGSLEQSGKQTNGTGEPVHSESGERRQQLEQQLGRRHDWNVSVVDNLFEEIREQQADFERAGGKFLVPLPGPMLVG